MNINDFIKELKDQFIDGDDISLEPQTNFRAIESWDSLTGMSVLVMIKDEYQVDMPVDVLKNSKTVQELYDFIVSNKK